jgi:hypothetical protein
VLVDDAREHRLSLIGRQHLQQALQLIVSEQRCDSLERFIDYGDRLHSQPAPSCVFDTSTSPAHRQHVSRDTEQPGRRRRRTRTEAFRRCQGLGEGLGGQVHSDLWLVDTPHHVGEHELLVALIELAEGERICSSRREKLSIGSVLVHQSLLARHLPFVTSDAHPVGHQSLASITYTRGALTTSSTSATPYKHRGLTPTLFEHVNRFASDLGGDAHAARLRRCPTEIAPPGELPRAAQKKAPKAASQ